MYYLCAVRYYFGKCRNNDKHCLISLQGKVYSFMCFSSFLSSGPDRISPIWRKACRRIGGYPVIEPGGSADVRRMFRTHAEEPQRSLR